MGAAQMMQLGETVITTDPSYASVAFLLHMSGTNGGTTFTDNGPAALTFTASGNAQTLSAQFQFSPTSMGPSSLKKPILTSGTRVGIALNQQFTVEGWLYANGFGGNFEIFKTSSSDVADGEFYCRVTSGPSLTIANTSIVIIQSATVITTGSWHAFAFTRDGSNVIRTFLDGVLDATTATNGLAMTAAAGNTTVGSDGTSDMDGYLDEVRVTIGVCRYTATYTPATSPFPNS